MNELFTIIILELLALLFAFATGRHDVPAVDAFHEYGDATPNSQSNFHGFNWILKFCFVVSVSVAAFPSFGPWDAAFLAVANTSIIWAVFDPTINIFRLRKKPWAYLSKGNWTDRKLMAMFGEHKAGKIKLAICVLLFIASNTLMYFV